MHVWDTSIDIDHRRGGSERVDECLCKPPVCLTRRVAAGRLWATRVIISRIGEYIALSLSAGLCPHLFRFYSTVPQAIRD